MKLDDNIYKTITITFIITALWDVVLRIMSENYDSLPTTIQNALPFIGYLKPYFEKLDLLSAALVAGFVGACTQLIIIKLGQRFNFLSNLYYLLAITFVISALFGFVMKFSKLFPTLDETYYKNLGTIRGMYHDGVSGLIVQGTFVLLIFLKIIK